MVTPAQTEARYDAAIAYLERAIAAVDPSFPSWSWWSTSLLDQHAGDVKTEPVRNELARTRAKWLRATSETEREAIAREAERLADRTQENLPGAPQNRQRTNLAPGEIEEHAPSTTFVGEALGINQNTLSVSHGPPLDWKKIGLAIAGVYLVGKAIEGVVSRRRS